MDIVVVGTGYVGMTVAWLAAFGHKITMLGKQKEKSEMINKGISPIYEPGLEEILQRNIRNGMLNSTTDYSVVKDADVVFICVGPPSKDDGSRELAQVEDCATAVAEQLKKSEKYKSIVVKSTVLPKTTKDFVTPILEKVSGK